MISIIIPVYNVEKYLPKCIETVEFQTYKNIEIILVDDGSTDGSGRICDDFSKEYSNIKVIHILNGGVSNARNVGIKNATGEWITFVDSDDFLDETHIENLYTGIADNVDLVISDYRIVSSDGIIISDKVLKGEYSDYYTRRDALEAMGQGNSIWGYVWNKLFKREILLSDNIFFDSDIKIWEDMLFCAEYLFYASRVRIVKDSTYNYIVRGGSAVNTKSFELTSTKFLACEKFEVLLTRMIDSEIITTDSQFSNWVGTIFAETGLDGILNGQFANGIYDNELINKYLIKVSKYKKFIGLKQKIELLFLKISPYTIFLVKRKKYEKKS